MTENINAKKNSCPYCGDAPVNHKLSYLENSVSLFLDSIFQGTLQGVPKFMVRVVDWLLEKLLSALIFFKLVKLSSDPERATTLRSRVIWNEAIKRGIEMKQLVIGQKYTDHYRAWVSDKYIFFNSLPVLYPLSAFKQNWDDKFFFKRQFSKADLPVPHHAKIPFFKSSRKYFFQQFPKPIIVKPRIGSRGRHTTTNINTWEEFEKAVACAQEISPRAVAEEHLEGYICRATCVDGKLVGFYCAEGAFVLGDGKHTIRQLIEIKNQNHKKRVMPIQVSKELSEFISRLGFEIDHILPFGQKLFLSFRTGRLFGGVTREMLDVVHPSFWPVLERAAKIIGLPVVGLDCVIPNPEVPEKKQRWGIIECNTLPFIDLHYFALTGKPRNIAGMIWDFWDK